MDSSAFYLFLRWLGIEMDESRRVDSAETSQQDLNIKAMVHLSADKRKELVDFIDHELAAHFDTKSLSQLFDDGHLFFKWRDENAPRQFLLSIREAALTNQLASR